MFALIRFFRRAAARGGAFAMRALPFAAALALLGAAFDARAQVSGVEFSAATASIAEGDSGTSNLQLTINTGSAPASALSVGVSIAADSDGATFDASATDYTAVTTAALGAGGTAHTLRIPIVGDNIVEQNEVFVVTLQAGTGYTLGSQTTSTVTITNDDKAYIFMAAPAPVVETNGTLTLTARLDAPVQIDRAGESGGSVDVSILSFGVGGSFPSFSFTDTMGAAGADGFLTDDELTVPVSWTAKATTGTAVISSAFSDSYEGLQVDVGYGGVEIKVVSAAPTTPVVSFNTDGVRAGEGDSWVAEIFISPALATASTVNFGYAIDNMLDLGDAVAGADFTNIVSFTLPASETSVTLEIPTFTDAEAEGEERIILNMTAISGAPYEIGPQSKLNLFVSDDDTPFTSHPRPGLPVLAAPAPGDGSLTISWYAPARTGASAITGYKIRWAAAAAAADYLNTGGADGADVSGGASASAHTITGLTNGTEYAVQVAAVNAAGTGFWSAAQRATPSSIPAAPSALTATPADASLSLAWTTPAEDGGAAITGYRYRWSNDNDATTWENAARSGGTAADGLDISGGDASTVEYTLASLTNGATYAVQIAAVNANGIGDWSASAKGRPLAAPGAPAQLEADPGDTELLLMWMPPAETGGADAGELIYQVRWRADAATSFAGADAATTDAGEVSYRITGLTNGTTYLAEVRAQNDIGTSDWSAARAAPEDFHIDFDAGGDVGWAEGVAVLRYILGLRGDALVDGLPGLDSGDAARIVSRLDANRDDLDVNGSGGVTAADGILIARFFLGVGDDDLLTGQAAAGTNVETVKTAIDALNPAS